MVSLPTYRLGDVLTDLGALRLTLAGLAELADQHDAPCARRLAQRIRVLNPDMARHLLTVLLRPSGDAARVARLTPRQVLAYLPSVTTAIVRAFSAETGASDDAALPNPHREMQKDERSGHDWPFHVWLRLAVRQFHMSPSEFWALPVADWLALIAPDRPALGRGALHELMKDYPDD